MTISIRAVAVAAGLACTAMGAPSATAQAQDATLAMSPHKAVYAIGLGESREQGGVSGASGSIAYGVQKVCGGWVLAQSGTMNIHLPSGVAVPQVLHYSSWEADDGNQYRFTVTTEGQNQEIILGQAAKSPGKGGKATYERPERMAYDLPADTLFPVAHTRFMIDSARAGKTQVQSHIFEGTEVEGAKLLVVFISSMTDQAKAVIENVGGDILDRPGWNFRLAYFDPADQSGEPLYEIEADMLDNGIAPRWVLDYGSYSVVMTIAKIQAEGRPDC